jgi:hypothetical protein
MKIKEITQRIYDHTQKMHQELADTGAPVAQCGFQVLTSPPLFGSDLFVLSSNPGFSRLVREQERSVRFPSSWPPHLTYLDRVSPFARKLMTLFDHSKVREHLSMDNIDAGFGLFARSRSIRLKRGVPTDETWEADEEYENIRRKYEKFSFEQIESYLRAARPKRIFCVGLDVGKKLCPEVSHQYLFNHQHGAQLLSLRFNYGDFENIPVMAVPHLSGYPPMASNMLLDEHLAPQLAKFLSSSSAGEKPEREQISSSNESYQTNNISAVDSEYAQKPSIDKITMKCIEIIREVASTKDQFEKEKYLIEVEKEVQKLISNST